MFKTTSSNCNALQQPGAFLGIEPPLNPVVRDAIEVSRRLAERYLWIDALCIPQDNEIQKAKLITGMDSIYAQAFLTIVALSADSAESPLPGVRQDTRLANIASVQLSITRTDERLPNKFLAVRPSLYDVLRKGSYNSRGWTFQESCLSRRCLIFTDHGTFFHCDSGLESDSGMSATSDAWPERNILSSVFETRENSLDVCYQYNLYTRLVFDFSKRKLTYSEDSLKAISGIFAVLSSRFGWRFVAGMPSHLMGHALLWRSASPNQLRNPNFPSWSWAGWSGRSHWNFQSLMDPLWTESEIRNAPLVPLQSEIEILQELNTEALSSLDTHDRIRISVLHVNVDSVRMGTFQITPGKPTRGLPDHIPIAPYEEIWTTDGLRCGILYDFQGDKRGVHKFIALSRSKWTKERVVFRGRVYGEHFTSWFGHVCDDKKLAFSEYCLVNVMLVVTKETETERVGIGLIHNDVWQMVAKVRENMELR
ncbi:HET-domain-containing protein [Zopfia rhizophila CBS 207.26]|uniref:HET-domain-containing protein n=1 Tax=Zopfia rhizophila CBS 207.26 TaxID=1314779 RepID=A0A6A6EID1_9PEZI|nr:HET-domain-containing protein [Zopfia rhizophila CBS 207.26]